jgi:histidinol-phosphate aminotransferase
MMEIKDLIRENIKSLEAYSSARDEFKAMSSEFVFIDANENPFDTGLNRYPDSQQTLVKEALSKLKGISEEQILLGNGSDEVLDLIFRVFCEPRETM